MFGVPKVVCHVEDPQLQVIYSMKDLNVVSYSVGVLQDIRYAVNSD